MASNMRDSGVRLSNLLTEKNYRITAKNATRVRRSIGLHKQHGSVIQMSTNTTIHTRCSHKNCNEYQNGADLTTLRSFTKMCDSHVITVYSYYTL